MKIKEEYENGLLNGTRLVYYQNGEKQVDETYQFGMVTGLVKNYYEDGKLLSESYYRGNIGNSNGLFHRPRRPCLLPGRAPRLGV